MLEEKHQLGDEFCNGDPLVIVPIPPRYFKSLRGDICSALGLRYVVPASYDVTTQRLGILTEGNDHLAHYEIIDLTAEQIAYEQAHALAIGINSATEIIRQLRQTYLDKLVKSPGISAVHETNIKAVGLWEGGLPDEVIATTPEGVTITALIYLTDLAVAEGKTVAEFCTYVRDEESAAMELRRQVEIGYLDHKKRAFESSTPAVISTEYQTALKVLFQGVII